MTNPQNNDFTFNNIKSSAVKSVKWTALGEIVSRSIQPIVTLVLTRFLTPADFGVVGVAMIAVGLAQIFQDFGLGKTLIQRETEVDKSANIIFWTNITLSLLLYGILFLSAPLLSRFFHEPKVIDVLRVLCLQIIFLSLISVHQALFQRNFQFKQLFFIGSYSGLVICLVSIPLALFGYGVWALVFGTLAGSIVQVLLYWRLNYWRPRLSYDFQLAKQLFGFSSWVAIEAFLLWMIGWGDSIILGHFLGITELGIYRVGTTFLLFVFGVFLNPLLPVSYSLFSRLQSNHEELKQTFLKTIRIIVSISLPLGVGLTLLSPAISSVVFEQKWQGIEIVITIIGLMYGIGWTVGLNHELYRAIGRPDINTKLTIILILYYIPVYVLAAPYGLYIFCLARFALGISSILFYLYFTKRVLDFPLTYLWDPLKTPLIASLIMAVLIYLAINLIGVFKGFEGWLKMFGIIAFGGMTYILAIRLIEKDLVRQFLRLAREGIK